MAPQSKPSPYSPIAFHGVRAMLFISAAIVSGILSWFFYQLKHDGFKLPWTFLVMMAPAYGTVLVIIITYAFYFWVFLSPIWNMILNVPIIIFWIAGMALFTYDMYGALGHACSTSSWANNDGVTVCNTYKALYSFLIIGLLCHLASLVVDIRARRAQTALGKYTNMAGTSDDKLDALSFDRHSSTGEVPYGFTPDEHRERPAPAAVPMNDDRFAPDYTTEQYLDRPAPQREPTHQRLTPNYDNGQGGYMMTDFSQRPQQTGYNDENYYAAYRP